VQQGWLNQVAVNEWILANEGTARLSSKDERTGLVLTGGSAGSQGMQFWAPKLLQLFAGSNTQAGVVLDSFLSISPPSYGSASVTTATDSILYGPSLSTLPTLNLCQYHPTKAQLLRAADLLPYSDLYLKCLYYSLRTSDVAIRVLETVGAQPSTSKAYGSTPVGYITTKFDSYQLSYWDTLAQYIGLSSISRWTWYREAVSYLTELKNHTNFAVFIVEAPYGYDHTFISQKYFYTTTTSTYNSSATANKTSQQTNLRGGSTQQSDSTLSELVGWLHVR
jgi:hypothetical protein